MTAREYLRTYKAHERRLRQLYSRQISYDYGIGSIDYAKDRVQSSPTNGAGFEDEVIRAVDKQAEIEKEIKCIRQDMDLIIERIEAIKDTQYRNVLYLRYIRGMSLLQVASDIGYSLDYTKVICSGAVRAFAIKYDFEEAQ